jgi:hypothetical protein
MHLRTGSKGEEVRKLQEALAEREYDVGPADGDFGPHTRRAVIEFQRERDLEADGVVRADTWEALDNPAEFEFPEIEPERAAFRRLIVENPNYFGTYPELPFEQEEAKAGDTSYEELTCVGYEPGVGRLEAIISVKREAGYSGDVCTDGSTEYVRFFIDRERDGTWEDLGITSTRVYDVPGDKPLDYAASLQLDEAERLCSEPNLPRVRAILSWQDKPPAGEPDHQPVWGNRLDADIQIEDRDPLVGDVVDASQLADQLAAGLDLTTPLAFEKQSLDAGTLLQKYENTSVPAHRAGFTAFSGMLGGEVASWASMPHGGPAGGGPLPPDFPPGDLPPEDFPPEEYPPEDFPPDEGPWPPDLYPDVPIDIPPDLDIDIGDVLGDLSETAANTQYEELTCVGLHRSTLTGVFTVKKPAGYSGGLCDAGSPEYVAFWEWDDSAAGWSHLGTTSVQAHDISEIPGDGLDYAAHLPVDLSHHRKPCGEGPSVVRIRAVLSWNQKPPASDPNFEPTWGNRVETHVHVPPGPAAREEGRITIGTVGDVPTPFIEQAPGSDTNGTATTAGTSVMNGFTATEAPFGGLVTITGIPDDGLEPAASGPDALKYRISYRSNPPGSSPGQWQRVENEFDVYTYDQPWLPQTMSTDSDGFYTYVPGTINDVLAQWRTSGDGIYELRVEAKRGDGTPVHTDLISFSDGTTSSQMFVQLDNTRPEGEIEITGIVPSGSTSSVPAADCEFLNVGDTLVGEFTADDEHLRAYRLFVRPTGPANGASVQETSTPTVLSQGGGDGTWKLETEWEVSTNGGTTTEQMDRCGYTIHVRAIDNTIVNNHHHGHRAHDSSGFCLLGEGEEIV